MKPYLLFCLLIIGTFGCENDFHLTRLECPHPYLECDNPDGGHTSDASIPDVIEVIDEVIDSGLNLEPDILVAPVDYDFGDIESGCEEVSKVKISNIGNAPLIINEILYSATSDLYVDYPTLGPFPWTIQPWDYIEIDISFFPLDEMSDLAYMTIKSNDPDEPVVLATQQGSEHRAATVTDIFEQTEVTKTDILFVVDNSGSMGEEQSSIATHASDFIMALDALAADYQIAVITTDDETFVGPVITNSSPSRVADLTAQIVVGTFGSAQEKGFKYAQLATSTGGDATATSGFIRPDSLLNIIFVSDENDYSTGLTSTYVLHFQSLKIDPSEVMLHAVVGDVPGGCGTASAGTKYYDASISTGGLFYSICSATWGTNLQNLAYGSTTSRTNFPLSEIPLEATIRVHVDGLEWFTDWSYDQSINSIIFHMSNIPSAGADIEIEYGIYGDCE